MAFTVVRRSPLAPEDAWAALTDFAAHTAHVPLTSVRTDPGEPHVGWHVVAVTAAGPARFSDPMYLTVWDPPRRFRMVKTGWLLAGWAEVEVEPDGAGSVISWREEISLHGAVLGRLTRPAGDAIAPRLFGPVVEGLLRAAEAATT